MDKNDLIAYLKVNNIWTKKSMGQNFLISDQVLTDIIQAAEIKSDDTVLEIGPGLGFLTAKLAEVAKKVVAVEKDDKLAEMLKSKAKSSNVEIINGDVLDFDPANYQLLSTSYKLVANIPYNITSLIIRKFLEDKNRPELMVLMVQKEVAERICAKPGEMSLLSLSVQFYAEPEIVQIVPASAFFPAPAVDSAIVKIRIMNNESSDNIQAKDFFRLAKFGFASRRKTLENNLAAGLHITKFESSDIIKKAGLESKIRAQDLSMGDWEKLYNIVYKN